MMRWLLGSESTNVPVDRPPASITTGALSPSRRPAAATSSGEISTATSVAPRSKGHSAPLTSYVPASRRSCTLPGGGASPTLWSVSDCAYRIAACRPHDTMPPVSHCDAFDAADT